MKQISLWETALVSVLFIVMICIDQHDWELFGKYVAMLAGLMLIGWFWVHRADLKHDLKVLSKCESPLKCRWIGTLVFFVLVILIVLALVVWILWSLGSLALNLG